MTAIEIAARDPYHIDRLRVHYWHNHTVAGCRHTRFLIRIALFLSGASLENKLIAIEFAAMKTRLKLLEAEAHGKHIHHMDCEADCQ